MAQTYGDLTFDDLVTLPGAQGKKQAARVAAPPPTPAPVTATGTDSAATPVANVVQGISDGIGSAAGAVGGVASSANRYLVNGDPLKDIATGIGDFFKNSAAQARTSDYGQMVPGDRSTAPPASVLPVASSAPAPATAAPASAPVVAQPPAATVAASVPSVPSVPAKLPNIGDMAPGTGVMQMGGKTLNLPAATGYDPTAEAQRANQSISYWKSVGDGVDQRAAKQQADFETQKNNAALRSAMTPDVGNISNPTAAQTAQRNRLMAIDSAMFQGKADIQNAGRNIKAKSLAQEVLKANLAAIDGAYRDAGKDVADQQKAGIDAGVKLADVSQRSKDAAAVNDIRRGELGVHQAAQQETAAEFKLKRDDAAALRKARDEYLALDDKNDPGGVKRTALQAKLGVLSGKDVAKPHFMPITKDDGIGGKEVIGFYNQATGATTDRYGKPETPPTQAPAAAIEFLKANPSQALAFKQKYGYLPQ